MKPIISKKGKKILRDYDLGRALMMCIHKKKYEHKKEHPMLFSVSMKDIREEERILKNK
jgi:hypothetical protein